MDRNFIDTITTMSGIVIIVAGFAASLIYCTRKKKDWKVIVTVPIVIAILIGVGFFQFGGSAVVKGQLGKVFGPKQAMQTICKYLEDGDYGLMYDSISTNSGLVVAYTRQQWIQHMEKVTQDVNGITECIVTNDIKENGNYATGTITIVNGLNQAIDSQYFLIMEDGEWKYMTGRSNCGDFICIGQI